jgi:4-aminobutyrate aminotransferase / (S)-3-amino-2-methylpropionate transaminase / 5-aminovalerate transaminase
MNEAADRTGKSNADLMARRRAALPQGLGQTFEVFVERAENAEVWDVEGKRYIDFGGGIAVLNVGHRHPKVIAAVKAQLDKFTHTTFTVMPYEPYVELAERLIDLAPGPFAKKCAFFNSGAEAVENAVKIARAATGRPAVISFGGSFHGRTNLTMGLTGKVVPYKAGFGPFPTDVYHAEFPNELHGVSVDAAIASVEHLLKWSVEASRVAAVILEPVQGEGGFYAAPLDFVERLRTLCDTHGILMIADEVQTGAGRTGTWLTCEQWPVLPDIITMAKSIGGGFPISAVIGRADAMDAAAVGGLGGTYTGSPIACAAALAVLEVFEEEKLLERSNDLGERLRTSLRSLASRHPSIVDVRGLGSMVAFEMGVDGDVARPDAALVSRVCREAVSRGLVVLSCGVHGNVIRILVPLTASDEIVDEGLAILAAAFDAAVVAG